MRHEDGSVQFFDKPLDPQAVRARGGAARQRPHTAGNQATAGQIVAVRQQAKKKVFVRNALRALERVAPAGNIRLINFVVLVGGSGMDFEIPKMISDALLEYGVVTGRANVRGTEGPRNAVATGLVLAHAQRHKGRDKWPSTLPCPRSPAQRQNAGVARCECRSAVGVLWHWKKRGFRLKCRKLPPREKR